MALKVITPPAAEPVTLTEAKAHLRAGDSEDTLITSLIKAAREYCEGFQNRAYITQTLELTFDAWPSFPLDVPRPPLASVTSIKYFDTANVEATFAATEYFVDTDSEPGRIVLAYGKSLPTTTLRPANAVKIRYVAGHPAGGTEQTPEPAANVPMKVKQAMLLLIGFWYDNREAVVTGSISKELEFSVHALLSLDRVVPV